MPLVLTGSGGAFSAGADITGEAGGSSGLTGTEMQGPLHELRMTNEMINRLHRLPKPTVALVDGVAAGVAAGLALACDFVIASDRAEFGIVFVKRGLALDGGTSWLLPGSWALVAPSKWPSSATWCRLSRPSNGVS